MIRCGPGCSGRCGTSCRATTATARRRCAVDSSSRSRSSSSAARSSGCRCGSSRAARGSTRRPSASPWCGRSAPSRPGRCTSAGSPAPAATTVRPVLQPVLVGLALAGLFVAGGLVVREIDWLDEQVRSVLDFADEGVVPAAGADHRRQRRRRGAVLPRCGVRRDPAAPRRLDDGGLRRRHGGDRQRDAGLRRDPARRRRRSRAPGLRRHPRADPHPRHLVDRRCSSPCRRCSASGRA